MNFWQTLLVNIVVTVVGGGGLLGMLTLRGQRRKLGTDADVGAATAAQVLTGTALTMVQHAESSAREAEARAQRAEEKADHAEQEALEAQHRLSRLIQWMRTQGITPPDWIEGLNQ